MRVLIKKLTPYAVIPKKQHESDAAYDLVVPNDTTIHFGRQIVPLDISIALPIGYGAVIRSRSGFAAKGMEDIDGYRRNANVLQGLIDSGYRGNVGVIVNSENMDEFIVPAGTRIAQMTIQKFEDIDFVEVESLDQSDRNDGGFGSTGAKS